MNDPQRKGLPCTIEAVSSEAQMTKQGGLSNGSPPFHWRSAWRRHLVNACNRQCWYCAHA